MSKQENKEESLSGKKCEICGNYHEESVKSAVKKLKKFIEEFVVGNKGIMEEIDRIFGDKLSGKSGQENEQTRKDN